MLTAQGLRSPGPKDVVNPYNLGNMGCKGGWPDQAFDFVKDNDGIESEKDYPYTAFDDQCWYDPGKKVADCTGYVTIPEGNETVLQIATATIGPISIAIDASQDSFVLYSSGVYNEPACTSMDLDHGVLIVGYGTDPKAGDYWIVKNSWGSKWGMQ